MKHASDILDLFCDLYDDDKRCRVMLPGDSQTYILEDCNPTFDYTSQSYTDNVELTLVNPNTLVSIRREIPGTYRIVTDGDNLRIVDDRIEDQITRIFEEAKAAGEHVIFVRGNGLNTFDWVEPRVTDRDHSLVLLEASDRYSQALYILVLTESTLITQLHNHTYEITGEYFVNLTSKLAPKI